MTKSVRGVKDNEQLEFEFLDGSRVLVCGEAWDRMYDVVEKTRTRTRLSRKFPFIAREKEKYVEFRLSRDGMKRDTDNVFRVRCSLMEFARMFDVDAKPFLGQHLPWRRI